MSIVGSGKVRILWNGVTAEQLEELEKEIVKEAQQAAFAKDM
jgi:hypothetical protein